MKFYRYVSKSYASIDEFGDIARSAIPDVRVVLEEYELLKETPKGYWIGFQSLFTSQRSEEWREEHLKNCWKKWVSKNGRKRFAYPTKEEAMNNYVLRTKKRISILKSQLRHAEFGLMNAEKVKT